MTEKEIKQLMDSMSDLIDKKIDDRIGNAVLIKSGIVTSISPDGLKASVRPLGEDEIISNIEVYNVRHLNVNDKCQLVYWGSEGKRLNNIALMFGGNSFR